MTTDLIRRYHLEGNLTGLITLFEALTDQRDRAESQNRSYLHQIKLLSTKFAEITEPASGRRLTEPRAVNAGGRAGAGSVRLAVEPMKL